MIKEMYSNNIKAKLSAELLGGNILLKICVGNEYAEANRFITTKEAEHPDVLHYFIETLVNDVTYYCNKKEVKNEEEKI